MQHCLKPREVRWFHKQDFCIGCTCVFSLMRRNWLDYTEKCTCRTKMGDYQSVRIFKLQLVFFNHFSLDLLKSWGPTPKPSPQWIRANQVKQLKMNWHAPLTEKHPLVFCTDTCLQDLVVINYKSLLVQHHYLHPCVPSTFIKISMLIQHTLNIKMSVSTKMMVWIKTQHCINVTMLSGWCLEEERSCSWNCMKTVDLFKKKTTQWGTNNISASVQNSAV